MSKQMNEKEVLEQVLSQLGDLRKDVHRLEVELKVELASLKSRGKMWGGLAGLGGGGAGVALVEVVRQVLGK